MALTQLGYWNKALYKIGAKRMSSLTDTGNPAYQFLVDIDPQCVQELLEEHVWSFAIQTVFMIPLAPPVWLTSTSYAIGNYVNQGNAIYRCAIAHTSGTFATDLASVYWVVQSGVAPLLFPLPSMNDGVSNPYFLPTDFVNPYLFSSPCFYRKETVKAPFLATTAVVMLTDDPAVNAMKYVFLNTTVATWSAKFYEAVACKLAYELCFKISEAAQWASKCEADYNKALMSAITSDSNTTSPDAGIANEWFIARLAGSGVVSGLSNGNVGFFPDPYNPNF